MVEKQFYAMEKALKVRINTFWKVINFLGRYSFCEKLSSVFLSITLN